MRVSRRSGLSALHPGCGMKRAMDGAGGFEQIRQTNVIVLQRIACPSRSAGHRHEALHLAPAPVPGWRPGLMVSAVDALQ
jgi:hypothetical protein